MTAFKIGQTLRDLASGFTGVATARYDFLNGNVQYGLQAPVKTGETALPDIVSFDAQTLEVVDDGLAARATAAPATGIALGQKVEDTVTGLIGIATMSATYLNGCVGYHVKPRLGDVPKGSKAFDGDWIDHQRLRLVDDGVAATIKPPARTGGAPMRMSRPIG